MERPALDKLYLASRGNPARVFQRALSEEPLEAATYGFLLDHVTEVGFDDLARIFNARLVTDAELSEGPFVRRLAEVVADGNVHFILDVANLDARISPEAWIEDLVLPLKGRIPNYQWYRLVDRARGGAVFNALNVGIPAQPSGSLWDPSTSVNLSFEENRPEPLVVAMLDRAHDDLACTQFALATLPVLDLLHLHRRFPAIVKTDGIKAIVPGRIASTDESWAPGEGGDALPEWLAPFVVERLRHARGAEARALYDWLFTLPPGSHDGDAYDLAVVQFKLAATGPVEGFQEVRWWSPRIGKYLTTGTSWKTRGRDFISLCIDLGRGFPPATLQTALVSTVDGDGATVEEHRASILRKVHDVTAELFVRKAEAAIKGGEFEMADLFLSAFLSLDPGSFIRGALHRLRKTADLPSEIVARIEGCQELVGTGGRDPSDEAFFEAFLVLTRQVK